MPSREPRVVESPRVLAIKETQLIDKAEEMGLLREAVDRAVHGQGGVAFLYGEAGIGKTRLARELAAYARLLGMRVLSGRCPALFRMDGVPPYILWKEVVKDYLETCTPEQLFKVIGNYPIEVSRLVPELKQMLRTIPESFPLSPENSRDRLFEAVSELVTNISRETPLLVILDDLQWTDESSLLLLHYLARGVYRESLLLLGAYRDTDVDERHPLIPVLTELNRERLLQSVQLKRMSLDDTSEMVKRILEQDEVSREFCELIYERTRGNPFFVEEVIRNLKEEEVIYREDDKWKVKEVSRIEFPETVKSVIKKRVSRLYDECQNILTLASFIGNDFTFEALCGVTGIEENKLLELVEKVLKTGLVKETAIRGKDVLSFGDVIVRDVVHEEVSHLRHKKLHSSVGNALEKVYAEKIDEHLGELAYHFLEGGEKDKALDYFLRAGERAANVYANAEAASYFQSAFNLLEEQNGELRQRASILEKVGDIKGLAGDHDACLRCWNDALRLWSQLDEKGNVARLHRKMANVLWDEMGDAQKAKEHQEIALKILETQLENVELASLYEDMAHMYYRVGDMDKALSWAEKALQLSKKLNEYEVMADSYTSMGTIFGFTGDLKKAVECLERALKIALDNGYLDHALRAYNNLSADPRGEEFEKAFECSQKGYELAKRIGNIRYISFIGNSLAYNYISMGSMNKALELAEESVALDRKVGNISLLYYSLETLGWIYQILGEWGKSEQYYAEGLDISQKTNEFQGIASGYGHLGWLHFEKGEYPQAEELFEKSYETLEEARAKGVQMRVVQLPIMACIELGEIEKAKKLIDDLQKYADEIKDKLLIANADLMRGYLSRAEKKWEESIEFFEKGLRGYEALNARRWNVYIFARYVLSEYARVHLERNQKGDREKAVDLLNQALDTFQKLGAKKDIEKAESKIIYAETGRQMPPKPISAPGAVDTPSLIATGYSDLDSLLFGGIPRGYAVILTSPSYDERESLIKSFLETGVKSGEVTFYVTIDPSAMKTFAEEFPSSFSLFVCNPQADAMVKSLPNVFKLRGVENLTDISMALSSAIRKLDPSQKAPRRVCIGLVSDVLLQHHAVQTRRWLAGLIPELRSQGFTTLVVMDPEMHHPQEVRAVLDLFEGEISIYEKEAGKESGKYLKIKKMSNRKYLEKELFLTKEERK